MQLGGLMGGFYAISEWILRFMYINFLWVLFFIPGIFIFGFFPSTAALFAVVRKWVSGETDVPVFKTFWQAYKRDFVKSNILGWIMGILGYVLYIDLQLIQSSTNSMVQMIFYPLLLIIIIYVLLVLYVFPVFAHFDISIFQVIKHAFIIMIISPLQSIIIIAGGIAIYYIMVRFPVLILIFGISFFAYVVMWSADKAFIRIAKKQQLIAEIDNEE